MRIKDLTAEIIDRVQGGKYVGKNYKCFETDEQVLPWMDENTLMIDVYHVESEETMRFRFDDQFRASYINRTFAEFTGEPGRKPGHMNDKQLNPAPAPAKVEKEADKENKPAAGAKA